MRVFPVLEGLDWRQPGVYSQPPEGQKLIPAKERLRSLVAGTATHSLASQSALNRMLNRCRVSNDGGVSPESIWVEEAKPMSIRMHKTRPVGVVLVLLLAGFLTPLWGQEKIPLVVSMGDVSINKVPFLVALDQMESTKPGNGQAC